MMNPIRRLALWVFLATLPTLATAASIYTLKDSGSSDLGITLFPIYTAPRGEWVYGTRSTNGQSPTDTLVRMRLSDRRVESLLSIPEGQEIVKLIPDTQRDVLHIFYNNINYTAINLQTLAVIRTGPLAPLLNLGVVSNTQITFDQAQNKMYIPYAQGLLDGGIAEVDAGQLQVLGLHSLRRFEYEEKFFLDPNGAYLYVARRIQTGFIDAGPENYIFSAELTRYQLSDWTLSGKILFDSDVLFGRSDEGWIENLVFDAQRQFAYVSLSKRDPHLNPPFDYLRRGKVARIRLSDFTRQGLVELLQPTVDDGFLAPINPYQESTWNGNGDMVIDPENEFLYMTAQERFHVYSQPIGPRDHDEWTAFGPGPNYSDVILQIRLSDLSFQGKWEPPATRNYVNADLVSLAYDPSAAAPLVASLRQWPEIRELRAVRRINSADTPLSLHVLSPANNTSVAKGETLKVEAEIPGSVSGLRRMSVSVRRDDNSFDGYTSFECDSLRGGRDYFGNSVDNCSSGLDRAFFSWVTTTTGTYTVIIKLVNEMGVSSATFRTTTVTLPVPVPTHVQAFGGDGQVAVSWAPTNFIAYKVYGSAQPGVTKANAQFSMTINFQGPDHATFFDLPNGVPAYFVVTAIQAGVESAASAEVTATPHADPGSPWARYDHSALYTNNKVWMIGGWGWPHNSVLSPISDIDALDPATSQWSGAVSRLPAGVSDTRSVVLPSGKILIVGRGGADVSVQPNTVLFDPIFRRQESVAQASKGHFFGHTVTVMANGNVLVAGGDADPVNGSPIEVYDPTANRWTTVGSLSRRVNGAATLLGNGKVLISGGIGWNGDLDTCFLYDPLTQSLTPTGSMPYSLWAHAAVRLDDGKVLAVGREAELYDPATETWAPRAQPPAPFRQTWEFRTATKLNDGRVLFTGGSDTLGVTTAQAAIYNPTTDTWALANPMSIPRRRHAATLLPNGRVVVTGGLNQVDQPVSTIEYFDPVSGQWSALQGLPIPTNVQAISGDRTVTLSCNAETGVTGFMWYGSLQPGVTKANATMQGALALPLISPTITLPGLTNGQPYYFIITAKNASGESAPSAEVSATPQALQILTSALPDGRAGDAYAGPVYASGGRMPYHWNITGLTGFTAASSGANDSATIQGVPRFAGNYPVSVSVTDEDDVVAIKPFTLTILPANLAGPVIASANPGNGEVTLTWNAVAGADSYNIWMSQTPNLTPNTTPAILAMNTSQTSHTVLLLTNGVPYYFRVVAVTASGGEGVPSAEVTATPSPVPVVSLPAPNLQLPNQMAVNATISFSYPVSADHFEWSFLRQGDVTPTFITSVPPQMDLSLIQLKAGVYTVTVKATRGSDASATTSAVVTLVLPAPVFHLPSTLSINSDITLDVPRGVTFSRYEWSFTPTTPAAPQAAAPAFSSHQVAGAAFPTSAPKVNPAALGLSTGYYSVTVTAFDPGGSPSLPAQAFVSLVSADLSSVRVYPSPWRSDQHDGHDLTFTGLPEASTIKIFTTSGRWVKTIPNVNGQATWNLKNDNGESIASGLYLYVVTDGHGNTSRGKFGVIR